MRLHAEHPEEGFGAAALFASERGRARSLLELLHESSAEIRRGVDTALLERERELERIIARKAEQQTRSGKQTEAEAIAAVKELDALATELEQVQSRIRETSPQYAALTHPVPLELSEIQTKVLDDDTVLLEYALGSEKSFVWAVTTTSMDVFELRTACGNRIRSAAPVRPADGAQSEAARGDTRSESQTHPPGRSGLSVRRGKRHQDASGSRRVED